MTANCPFCTHPLSKNEEANIKLYGKHVCNSKECLDKANAEAIDAAGMLQSPRDGVISWLAREGFKEQSTKDFFLLEDGSNIGVDIRNGELTVGVCIGGQLVEEGHGVSRVDDVRRSIQALLNRVKEGPSAPKPEPKVPEVVEKPEIKSGVMQGCMIKGFAPQLKEIGKIKIGKKGALKDSVGGKQFRQPVKFDHFEITNILKDDKTDDFLPDPIMRVLGDKPTELDILLLYNDVSLNFRTRYNAYAGGKCVCVGDGETATTIEGETRVCNPDACEIFQKKKCKVNGILSCILMKSPRLGGVYKFRTTSFHTVRSILSSLMFLSTITGGVLSMLPLKLMLSPMKVQPKDTQITQTIYVANVEFAGTAQELLQTMFEVQKYQGALRAQILELEQTARLALNAPESDEESREVQDEFFPPEEKQEVKK